MKRIGIAITLMFVACRRTPEVSVAQRPSILFVTLDTTRADAIGADTPNFNALAKEGQRFLYAYATVPQTLPSHTSMLTGLYPGGHGLHENGRYLAANQPLVSEQLKKKGYRTAAFVSAFALARRFGLARGFDVYDDDFGKDREERNAKETTDRVLAWLAPSPNPLPRAGEGAAEQRVSAAPLFLWVHYWDPHYPYTPPEPYGTRYAKQPYLGEVAFMDEQLGRLVQAFRERVTGPKAILIAGDHGEGLGDHGEAQHGNLLYESTMHVPMLVIGPGVKPGTTETPVSTRAIAQAILDWPHLNATDVVVAGEAMKPYLDYGWQPQVMAVEGRQKAIRAGRIEVYDVVADPGETHDLGAQANLTRGVRATLRDYPLPSAQAAAPPSNIDDEERRKLAALGYISSTVKPVIRADAPRPADMAHLFPVLDKAASLFVAGRYRECVPLLEQILAADPHNLDAALRLATAYSSLSDDRKALAAFERAQTIAPDSQDVRTYLALHYARGKDWPKAVPLLERVVAESPDRVPALEALAVIRERQNRLAEAVQLREKIYALRAPTPAELEQLGAMQMALGQTEPAIATFERLPGHDLELGVLYLAAGRLTEARDALDRVPPSSPGYPMALFKRAQVSVLLKENDAPSRIEMARRHATPLTRELIARERLFR